ncbi:MAG: hypothetical protein QNJ18_18680 [Xenococcaceae cyanobacterium MO_167.B52]|nr:hypothetical protein [Xenococcaceae cyanobacterium MO_167.B52]
MKTVRLEALARRFPSPIKLKSRVKKLQRFLSLKQFNIKTLWFPIIKSWIEEDFNKGEVISLAIDRSQWQGINLLMVSLMYDKRGIPVYFSLLPKKGNSNLAEPKKVLEAGRTYRRHSNFSIGLHGQNWVDSMTARDAFGYPLGQKAYPIAVLVFFQDIVQELLRFSTQKNDYYRFWYEGYFPYTVCFMTFSVVPAAQNFNFFGGLLSNIFHLGIATFFSLSKLNFYLKLGRGVIALCHKVPHQMLQWPLDRRHWVGLDMSLQKISFQQQS